MSGYSPGRGTAATADIECYADHQDDEADERYCHGEPVTARRQNVIEIASL
jgi:hypothetical protein